MSAVRYSTPYGPSTPLQLGDTSDIRLKLRSGIPKSAQDDTGPHARRVANRGGHRSQTTGSSRHTTPKLPTTAPALATPIRYWRAACLSRSPLLRTCPPPLQAVRALKTGRDWICRCIRTRMRSCSSISCMLALVSPSALCRPLPVYVPQRPVPAAVCRPKPPDTCQRHH